MSMVVGTLGPPTELGQERCMTAGVRPVLSVLSTAEEMQSDAWPFGTVVQELHTGDCCNLFHFCDVYAPMWEMAFQSGWARVGNEYDPEDQPRLPVQLLFVPDGSE